MRAVPILNMRQPINMAGRTPRNLKKKYIFSCPCIPCRHNIFEWVKKGWTISSFITLIEFAPQWEYKGTLGQTRYQKVPWWPFQRLTYSQEARGACSHKWVPFYCIFLVVILRFNVWNSHPRVYLFIALTW